METRPRGIEPQLSIDNFIEIQAKRINGKNWMNFERLHPKPATVSDIEHFKYLRRLAAADPTPFAADLAKNLSEVVEGEESLFSFFPNLSEDDKDSVVWFTRQVSKSVVGLADNYVNKYRRDTVTQIVRDADEREENIYAGLRDSSDARRWGVFPQSRQIMSKVAGLLESVVQERRRLFGGSGTYNYLKGLDDFALSLKISILKEYPPLTKEEKHKFKEESRFSLDQSDLPGFG